MNKNHSISSFLQNFFFPVGAFSLAILLWLFVISGNQYSMVLDIPIEARNLNSQKTYLEEVPDYASVMIKGKGRDLFKSYLLQNFANFKLVLDLDGISQKYEFILNEYFDKNPRKVVFPSSYNVSFVEVIYPNRIKISLDEIVEKTVPVISNIEKISKDGHVQVGKIIFNPDSITLTGPKIELEKIFDVKTMIDTLENLSKFTSAKIGLIIDNRLIKYSEKKVQYSLNIQQISERIIVEIPVKVINKVKGLRVFPSPQTVSLTVIGGSTQISKIKSSDISVIVDFKDWVLEKKFYIPTVSIPFDILSWTDLSPRAIEIGVARESK